MNNRIPVIQYDEALADRILHLVSEGMLLREIYEEDDRMPSPSVVRQWVVNEAGFSVKFARALEMQAHMFFEEAVWAAKSSDSKRVSVDRLRIETFLKAAGKLLPKVYGDKADITAVIPLQVFTNLGDGRDDTDMFREEYRVSLSQHPASLPPVTGEEGG